MKRVLYSRSLISVEMTVVMRISGGGDNAPSRAKSATSHASVETGASLIEVHTFAIVSTVHVRDNVESGREENDHQEENAADDYAQ